MMGAEPVDSRGSAYWTLALWLIALTGAAAYPFARSLAGFQDGDGLMTALISTQKLTWYFWGQDRLLNFIPALASPFSDLETNLRVQIFLRTLFAFLAPAGILCFLTDNRRTQALGVMMTTGIMTLALSAYGAFNLFVQHNPFATSLVLTWFAWRLFQRGGIAAQIVVVPLMAIAYAVNLALFAVTVPLMGLIFVLGSHPRLKVLAFGLLNVVALYIAVRHAAIYGDMHGTSFGLSVSVDAMRSGYTSVANAVAWPWVLTACLIMLAVGTWRGVPRTLTALGIVFGFVLMIGVLSCASWAQDNGFNIRYYLVFVLAVVSASVYMLFAAEEHSPLPSIVAPAACGLLLIVGFFAGLGGISSTPHAMLQPPWRNESPPIAALAIQERTPLIVGSFWDAWSAVYEVNIRADKPFVAYGGAMRGRDLRDRVAAMASPDGTIRALCFLDTPQACAGQASNGLKTPMTPVAGDPGKVVTTGGKTVLILALRFVDPAAARRPAIGPWGRPYKQ
ncbi:MAG TPA: hypothetical protein VGN46_16580 [Luteibacter sp.]|jgi:hypothetical protein|uniref:hypothetical protein n=1 Tax=Luteibacter sp. TaxID=1886636 RepID=UPI002F42A019